MMTTKSSGGSVWKCGGLGLAIILLGLAPQCRAQATTPSSSDSLTAAAIAFQLRYDSPAAPGRNRASTRDRWLGRDKVQHVLFSGLWTLSTQYVLVSKADWTERDALPASVASGATIGILKELYDASRLTGTASGKDLVADAVGIGLAVMVIKL